MNTISFKFQNQHNFKHGMFQTALMFVGEYNNLFLFGASLVSPHILFLYQDRRIKPFQPLQRTETQVLGSLWQKQEPEALYRNDGSRQFLWLSRFFSVDRVSAAHISQCVSPILTQKPNDGRRSNHFHLHLLKNLPQQKNSSSPYPWYRLLCDRIHTSRFLFSDGHWIQWRRFLWRWTFPCLHSSWNWNGRRESGDLGFPIHIRGDDSPELPGNAHENGGHRRYVRHDFYLQPHDDLQFRPLPRSWPLWHGWILWRSCPSFAIAFEWLLANLLVSLHRCFNYALQPVRTHSNLGSYFHVQSFLEQFTYHNSLGSQSRLWTWKIRIRSILHPNLGIRVPLTRELYLQRTHCVAIFRSGLWNS